jgi:DNA-directed RNA polymerase specialized sigma24 family protein
MTIESLVLRYQATKSPELFREIYGQVAPILSRKRSYDNRYGYLDNHELAAAYDDAIVHAVNKYRYGSFMAFLYTVLKFRKLDMYRKHAKRPQFVDITDVPVVSPQNEDAIVNRMMADTLREMDGWIGDVIRLVSDGMTVHAAAVSMGLHNTTVRRALKRLTPLLREA